MKRAPIAIAKILVFIALAVIVIIAAALLLVRDDEGANSPTQPVNTNEPSTPDRVKQQSGATGDNQPSSTGTDPDGNNTLLNQ